MNYEIWVMTNWLQRHIPSQYRSLKRIKRVVTIKLFLREVIITLKPLVYLPSYTYLHYYSKQTMGWYSMFNSSSDYQDSYIRNGVIVESTRLDEVISFILNNGITKCCYAISILWKCLFINIGTCFTSNK